MFFRGFYIFTNDFSKKRFDHLHTEIIMIYLLRPDSNDARDWCTYPVRRAGLGKLSLSPGQT